MSERIQVKRDGEHRGWVAYIGVNGTATDEGWDMQDEWRATREITSPVYRTFHETFPSRYAAIRWLVEGETT